MKGGAITRTIRTSRTTPAGASRTGKASDTTNHGRKPATTVSRSPSRGVGPGACAEVPTAIRLSLTATALDVNQNHRLRRHRDVKDGAMVCLTWGTIIFPITQS